MHQTLLSRFGNPVERVEKAIRAIQQGQGVIVTDDENRENEGDLIFAAQSVTVPQMRNLIRDCSGIVCLCLTAEKAEALGLTPMVEKNSSRYGTAFTVSIDAAEGITTGVSAADRVRTVQAAIADNACPEDLARPGHMFPLVAMRGGVLQRKGHTEATVDLPRLAGLKPYGLLCELMNPDGSMSRLPQAIEYAEAHGLVVITIDDLATYRLLREKEVNIVARAKMPTEYGEFNAVAFRSNLHPGEHLALVMGDVTTPGPVLVRVDSECATGEIFGSLRCDCGAQMEYALRTIAGAGRGMVVFLRQEGRGIGLHNKIRAYALQDQGMDTVEANIALGFPPDLRNYGTAAQIIKTLGVKEVNLLTNNPEKIKGLESQGVKVSARTPVKVESNPYNLAYLQTKKHKMGHL